MVLIVALGLFTFKEDRAELSADKIGVDHWMVHMRDVIFESFKSDVVRL